MIAGISAAYRHSRYWTPSSTCHLKGRSKKENKSDVMDTNVADRPNTNTVSSVCQTLITSVQKTATDVTAFVRRCRSARVDLAPTMRELSELQMVLQLLGDHDREQGGKKGAIPEELQMHLQPILTNCISTVLRIYSVLRQHGSEEGEGHLKWSAQGQHDVRELENLLVVYRSVLGLVSDLVSILVSSGSLDSPGQSSAGGMTPSGLRLPDVLQELQGLRLSVLASQGNATLAGQHLALQVHLGHIIAYALTMAKSEDWEKAVKTMDEAQKRTMATTGKDDMRGSIPATAPLRRIATTNETGKGVGDNYIVLDKGFENFLVGEDGSRSTSLLFAPHTTPEPGSLMAGGPSTGMMIMDGAGLPGMSGTNTSLQPMLQSNSSSANSRKTIVRRASGQQQNTMLYTTEKEVAIPMTKGHEEVTEEALAFAQVPVHILGRLSLNLVGHVYTGTAVDNSTDPMPGNVSGSSDQTSYNQSLSTRNTEEGFFDDDAASTRTSDMGSLHDGDLQFSQLDLSKPPPATMNEPLPPSKTTLASKTSFGSQEMPGLEHVQEEPLSQQLLPPLPLPPASIPTSQSLPPPLPPPPSQQSLSAAPTPTPTIVYPVSYSESQQVPHAPPRIPQPYQHERIPSTSTTQSIVYGPHRPPPPPSGYGSHSLREMRSISTMNTHTFINMQKPLPRTPLVYIPAYPGPFVKTKAVVVGNFSCGKTCLIT